MCAQIVRFQLRFNRFLLCISLSLHTNTHTHTEEFTIYNAGLVPSMFYGVIDSRDLKGFKRVLWQSALAVASAAVVCWHVTARVCNLTLC